MTNWKKLQNGSDIRGVALAGVEGEDINLTSEVANILGRCFVAWLSKHFNKQNISVAVGHDPRLSSGQLEKAVIEGLKAGGAAARDCGLASTPAMFMTTMDKDTPTDGAIMITASHLPWNRNGLKFFTPKGGLGKQDIKELLEMAEKGQYDKEDKAGQTEPWPFMDKYCEMLRNYIKREVNKGDHPLKGLDIVVDAGNGSGGFFPEKVLSPLGADISGGIFLNPDGHFPNHAPNPESAEAMMAICQAVTRHHADLGIIFDTDVDRSAVVDHYGDPINRNTLIALIGAVILREHPGTTIVTDSVTSEGLTEFIKAHGGVHHRFKRGYKNVIDEAIRLNNEGQECWLAIETSGHAALRENFFLDDGAYLVAKLVIEAARMKHDGKDLSDLIQDLKKPAESKERRIKLTPERFGDEGKEILARFREKVAEQPDWKIVEPNYEGVRVSCTGEFEQGWFLLRLSLHDPVMVLNIESNTFGGVAIIEEKINKLLEELNS